MFFDFASEEDLLDRLSARPHELVYLVGSAVTAPARPGEPGVPRVDGVIDLIRAEYKRPSELQRFEATLQSEPKNQYQAAFRFLLRTRDQDVANAVIRRAVLLARRSSPGAAPAFDDDAHRLCRALEDDLEGWHLPPAVEALGRVLAAAPPVTRPVVLTSNFDPLVAISVRRAGGRAYTSALHGDGSLAGVDGQGCLVVHFHGDWFRTDTLHTPVQLGQDRPRLVASLASLISARTLVVLGYGGWDDVFTRSLIGVIRGGLAPLKVAWAFYPDDPQKITAGSATLLEALRPGIELGRIVLYKGIDAHRFLPLLAERLDAATDPPAALRLDPTPFKELRRVLQAGCSYRADGPSASFLEHGARTVGIGYLRRSDSSEHLAWIMQRQQHYAPIKHALRAPDFIAFYAPRSKRGAGALTHVARVIAQEKVKRSEITTPWRASHASDEECVLYRLAQVEALECPIENHSGRIKLTETSAVALSLATDTRELHARDPRIWWLLGQLRVRQGSPRFNSGKISSSTGIQLEDGSFAQLNDDDQTVTILFLGGKESTVTLEEFFAQ